MALPYEVNHNIYDHARPYQICDAKGLFIASAHKEEDALRIAAALKHWDLMHRQGDKNSKEWIRLWGTVKITTREGLKVTTFYKEDGSVSEQFIGDVPPLPGVLSVAG